MSENTPGGTPGFQKGTIAALRWGWPLAASAVFLILGTALGTRTGIAATSPAAVTVLILLATLAGGAGAVALIRTPTAPPIRPYVGLAATIAALLALTSIGTLSPDLPASLYLLVAPWRFALTPLAVHFAFAIGWPHRHRFWSGLVIGWYVLHGAMLVAALAAILSGESLLVGIVDTTFRTRILEPAAVVTAIAALGVALMSPSRGSAQRRATGWAFAAILFGLGPTVLALVVPDINVTIDGAMTTARLAMALTAFLGFAAVLTLPFVNPLNRDLLAHRFAVRLLDETDLPGALREMAAMLLATFEAEGVAIRLATPPIAVVEGKSRLADGEAIAVEVETVDDQRVLVAPIGRIGDPLGELRLDARFAGSFGSREREWLGAFLMPVASALRARRREQLLKDRSVTNSRDVLDAVHELQASLGHLPTDASSDEMAVPPAVDASEVLGQLSDGLDGVSRRTDDLESAATEARALVRESSDDIATALDALRRFAAELLRLGTWGDEITASNQSVSGVAFRTNLLANNAALEATRAGSAGKTFGVLAEEIRRLADATASSSSSIDQATAALAGEVLKLGQSLEAVQSSLVTAIRKAESSEESARRVSDTAGSVLGHARSLRPAVEEAYAVAKRRSARDQKLTDTMERFLAEREQLAARLADHRTDLERIIQVLDRLGRRDSRPR